jgi:uncharacterized membrane protein
MIADPFAYLAILILLCAGIVYTEKRSRHKLFEYLPSIVILYFTVMLLSTFGVW